MRTTLLVLFLITVFSFVLSAQTPNDGIMMPERNWCNVLQYSHSSWDNYWEGATKRTNENIGTITTQSAMLMSNYGISDHLNILAGLPYVWTDSDISYLNGQKNIQDLSVWLKYQVYGHTFQSGSAFKAFATGGLSTPVSNYVPDFLPFSIGLQSKTASLRGILHFSLKNGLYATAQGGHTWRSDMTTDREAYLFHDELIYSNEVPVPNMVDASGRLGFLNKKIQAELWYEYFTGLSGDDIRYNDMPFPSNKMRAASAGFFAKYYFGHLAVSASASQVLSGRNVGQGTTVTGGIFYFFAFSKKTNTDK